MALGDSITAGFQSGVLVESLQRESYPSLIARQACVPMTLPLILDPGHPIDNQPRPFNLDFCWTAPASVDPSLNDIRGRTQPSIQPTNLAIPGAKLNELRLYSDGTSCPVNETACPLFPLVLSSPLVNTHVNPLSGTAQIGSELMQAFVERPTLVLLWAGNNDALDAALNTFRPLLTGSLAFKRHLIQVVRTLRRLGADIVLANIPAVSSIPHMLRVGRQIGQLPFTVLQDCVIGPVDITRALEQSIVPRGVKDLPGEEFPAGSLVPFKRLGSLNLITQLEVGAKLCVGKPLDGSESTFGVLDVLFPSDVDYIDRRITEFNASIASTAARYNLPVVDVRTMLETLPDRSFTSPFFSLDGIHPSNEGQRLIANAFIAKINERILASGSFGGLTEVLPLVDKAVLQNCKPPP